ncbi:MAG TPA: hypothetical protein VM327_03205 [Candidatus Thermoplasmatota archaeon]|nr:hypothetical protein [Candidatus Thermoplasmatota archaeon]
MATQLARVAWEALAARRQSRPREVLMSATYHPGYGSVIINVANLGARDIEVTRVVAQVHDRRRRRPMFWNFMQYAPLELPFLTAMSDERTGSRGNTILPGGSGLFTAGHQHLAGSAAKARWMTVAVHFGEKHLASRIDLRLLRRKYAEPFQEYEPKPGERIVEATELYTFVPSYPPRMEPARKIVKVDAPADRQPGIGSRRDDG